MLLDKTLRFNANLVNHSIHDKGQKPIASTIDMQYQKETIKN